MNIKTSLRNGSTDEQGNIENFGHGAFAGAFNLGLVLGSCDKDTKSYPTDEKGLDTLKGSLAEMSYKCFAGLSGIGAFVGAARLVELGEEDFANLGIAITNIADLGVQAQSHIEGIEMDLERRRKALMTEPEQLTEEA